MIRYLSKITFFVFVLASINVGATEEQNKFEDPQQRAVYSELIKELRCPKCQNQNIADSNAVVAKDMRAKTKQLVEQGQDKQQVIEYMVNRYGQFAHYQPPLNVATSLLWLVPFSFISLGIYLLIKRSRKNNSVDTQKTAASVTELDTTEAFDADLDTELNELLSSADDQSKGKK